MDKVEIRIELIRAFVQKMLKQGYAPWYIGEQIALIIKALDTKDGQ